MREYLLDVIDFWIDAFDIDGIRLDCADCLELSFLEDMRKRTDAKKEDFWLMGEVIHGDYSRYIGDGTRMIHSVTNYELHKGLYSGITITIILRLPTPSAGNSTPTAVFTGD